MNAGLNERVMESATTTGTGAFTLSGAHTGYQRFGDALSVGQSAPYAIEAIDANGNPSGAWETGIGTYSALNTWTRTTVEASSNADAAVDFAAGAKRVILTPTAAVLRRSVVSLLVSDPNGDAITTGDGKIYYRIPSTLNGMSLTAVAAALATASSSGAPSIQIHNVAQAADMLSTALTIDEGETDSSNAATPAVIDTGEDGVLTGEQLRIDIDTAGTGAKGLIVELQFS